MAEDPPGIIWGIIDVGGRLTGNGLCILWKYLGNSMGIASDKQLMRNECARRGMNQDPLGHSRHKEYL